MKLHGLPFDSGVVFTASEEPSVEKLLARPALLRSTAARPWTAEARSDGNGCRRHHRKPEALLCFEYRLVARPPSPVLSVAGSPALVATETDGNGAIILEDRIAHLGQRGAPLLSQSFEQLRMRDLFLRHRRPIDLAVADQDARRTI
jgi:hypothetical protein